MAGFALSYKYMKRGEGQARATAHNFQETHSTECGTPVSLLLFFPFNTARTVLANHI